MGSPAPDLSGLRIDRNAPSRGRLRALKLSAGLAGLAVLFVAAVFWWLRGGGAIDVAVAKAEVVGGGGADAVGITANGYVVARTKASVSSKISGRLVFLGVSEGSFVRRGQKTSGPSWLLQMRGWTYRRPKSRRPKLRLGSPRRISGTR
jgi:hypothetical protein